MTLLTRMGLKNNGKRMPCVIVHWTLDPDGLGYTGDATWFSEDGNKEELSHRISVRQTSPLGVISCAFNQCSGGSWNSTMFEGTSLTERDLQWAMAWAVIVKEDWDRKHFL